MSQHNEIIGVLAESGDALGYKIWVGEKEQSEIASGVIAGTNKLKSYVNADLSTLIGIKDIDAVEMIDLLWIKGKEVVAVFEVESTTTMTSGLVRGSNVPQGVPKYLVIPEEREDQLKRKMKSPMFADHFTIDNWKVLFFDTVRANYKKLKNKSVALEELVDKKIRAMGVKETEGNYSLFSDKEPV